VSIVLSPVPSGERRFVLEARDGDRVVARLRARRPVPTLLIPDVVEADVPPGRDVLLAFARAIATAAAGPRDEVLLVEKPELLALAESLITAGFRVVRRKVFVGRELRGALPPCVRSFTLRSLADIGDASMIERMAIASEGDPFEERKGADRDLSREWRELVDSAGERFDPTRWLLVDDARGPVGVVLPQLQKPEIGTLYYVGVVPARRRDGLGTALHALGLSLVRSLGATRYVGSTDVRNVAMRRVFERNRCAVEGTEAYYAIPPAP
jgi:RimJ/RimL family protein N-acetyltransferase